MGAAPETNSIWNSTWRTGVPSQMTHLVVSITLDSARSFVMQGFRPFILLLTVIIVTVAIVAVVVLVLVDMIIGIVVVVVGAPSIIKLVFVISVTVPSILWGNPSIKTSISFSVFGDLEFPQFAPRDVQIFLTRAFSYLKFLRGHHEKLKEVGEAIGTKPNESFEDSEKVFPGEAGTSGSPLNLGEDDLRLGNLKFVHTGEIDEIFGMQIHKEIITDNIRNAPYYNVYLEMVAKHEQKFTAKKESRKKKTAPKVDKSVKLAPAKQAKPATTKQPMLKPVKEKSTKPTSLQKAARVQAHVRGVAIREPIAEATQPLHVVEGKGKEISTEEQAAQSLLALHTPKRIKEQTTELDEGQARSDPSKTPESRPPPDDDKMDEDHAGSNPGKSHVALAGSNLEPMHDDFVATIYPKVHESLIFLADEQVILENPLSSSGTLSSMKILDDTYTFGDQFFNDKSTEYRRQSCLLPPKPVASSLLETFIAATTETNTTTLPLPPPLQQQRTTDSELAARVTALEKKFFDFEQKSQTLDNATQNLGSRVFTLELQDLPHKINQTVNEVVKDEGHIAFQAPLRDRFRELPKMIRKKFFINGCLRVLPTNHFLNMLLTYENSPYSGASAQLFSASGKSVEGMIQSGSRVSGLSSSGTGFNQSGLVLILGRCAVSVSSESEIFTSSGIDTYLTGCSKRGANCYLEELEGASQVSDIFQVEDCGVEGCFDLVESESCLFFLFRSKSGTTGGGS
nr:hypothetical protein [Tanacetum cinerariifolium]